MRGGTERISPSLLWSFLHSPRSPPLTEEKTITRVVREMHLGHHFNDMEWVQVSITRVVRFFSSLCGERGNVWGKPQRRGRSSLRSSALILPLL